MNWKNFALRFLGLITIAIAMFPLFGLTMNLLIFFNLIPAEMMDKAMGSVIVRESMYVWLACLALGCASLFLKSGHWRNILYFSPLYAPPLFAIVFTILQ